MTLVRTFGREPDPAKRLRTKWGKEMRETRRTLGWTLEHLAGRMTELGYGCTIQAISQWERGVNSPRHHHQIGWCKAVGRPHHEVFVWDDEAA